MDLVSAIGTGLTHVIGYAGQVVTALTGAEGDLVALLPVIGVTIAFGVVGWGIRTVKSLTWGF